MGVIAVSLLVRISSQVSKFSVVTMIKNLVDNYTWMLVVFYGSPGWKDGVHIYELYSTLGNWEGPILVGEDLI